jgi:signal transduction histidine kinase
MTRVLYAEDDPQIAEMVQLYFQRHRADCSLEVVDSGRRCLEAMQRGGYDVLLLDLMMPDLDGLQVLGELTARRDPTPVIMVSGQGQHELAVRALRAGAVDCIDKNSADFRRIPEIALHAHARNVRRRQVAPAMPGAKEYRVLYVDPDPTERSAAALFFAASAHRLHLSPEEPAALESFLRDETAFDAVVLGPNLDAVPMLDALRHLRAHDEDIPVIVISELDDGETTIAAFKLGAQDYLLHRPGCMAELVFSLHNALKRADTDRLNARLSGELAELNRSLADQVAARTRDLEAEIVVRRDAERRAEDNAARLQALSTRLLRVQEDERRALAQELHDQIGQLLTGLRFQLEAAGKGNDSPALGEALTLTDELLRSVRALTLQLRPRMLDDLGLKPALEWQTNLFHHQTGIAVELELTLPATRLSPELETVVFRMVQEALTNVARHSGSTSAFVTVSADDTALQVEIADRGRGCDATAALARRDSLGLAGIAERVKLAGGHFELFSQAGQGTRLHAEFALTASALAAAKPSEGGP